MILKVRDFVLDCSSPLVMGVLNITPDSFFDGGLFFKNGNSIDEDAVVEYAKQMVYEGADIIDVGGESTRPKAEQISEQEENRRVLRVVQKINAFTQLGSPLLVGLSRKSFIGKAIATQVIPPPKDRFAGTIAANTIAIIKGANILRVHDVKAAKDAIKLCNMAGLVQAT
ncbi:hypothetical protein CHS0354_000617 [Potamilus streckersoni]|uniref:Pterin-binding domain-containing protein n=1 Tax=Potamilus streckersoni TaxID=2493646 RepID=A0AAE0T7N8_9BIVA|nr:hypothetical protein CHS0354_000617 [Potamilus streckersoni]